jgi:predicted AAA+ superfamily ATPase
LDRKTLMEVVLEQDSKAKIPAEKGIISRDVMPDSGRGLSGNHMVIISGIRRCGKSTLLNVIRAGWGVRFQL